MSQERTSETLLNKNFDEQTVGGKNVQGYRAFKRKDFAYTVYVARDGHVGASRTTGEQLETATGVPPTRQYANGHYHWKADRLGALLRAL